jgi:lipoic acid synthetase
VTTGHPDGPPPEDEPDRVAEAVAVLHLRYVVVTSVDRDDLPDGGAAHFARTVQALKARAPSPIVELLTPDFGGDASALDTAASSGAEVMGHNVETVRELSPRIRDRRCSYDRSLQVLERFRAQDPALVVKSSLLLGLGETDEAVLVTLRDLRAVGVDWITLGQYLRPTRKHAPVRRFVEPEAFQAWADRAREMGFPLVTSGPLVRSSYRAAEEGAAQLIEKRHAEDAVLNPRCCSR